MSAVHANAAVFMGDRQIRTEEVIVRDPAPGEIRVRLQGCGVCASNLPVWDGRPWFDYPCAPGSPGHEGWGIVDAVGDGVIDFATGDRVAFLSSRAYAEYDVTPCDHAIRLPASLNDQPVPGEPLGCAMNIFRRSDIRAGQTVAIVGVGFLGAMLTDLCVRAGARVIAISRRSFARDIAEKLGATATLGMDDLSQTRKQARAHTHDTGFDRVIEAIGSQHALDLATELAGERAKLVIAGYHQEGRRTVDMQRWNWLGLDVINAHERDPAAYRRGMQEAIALMASGAIDPASLFTHRFPLSEINEGFEALAQRPPGFLKALVLCE
jgi:2-desacetyl-2-hydroxyethyl bacteriochlorophyllide A dehydrogenase